MPIKEPGHSVTTRVGHLIRRAMRRHEGELSAGPLVLAVSGGTDSMAMLLATAQVRRSLRRELIVAHFSHGIRRTAERGEAKLVQQTAAQLGLRYIHEQGHLAGDEASAREARYAFLGRVVQELGAAAALTAHTQDDQAETLLLRLTRGAGTRGAGSIRELVRREIDGHELLVLRPLLEATRSETETACREWGIAPASDGTNRSLRYARNRIRHRVLPDLQAINPDVRAALAHHAVESQDDEDALQQAAQDAIGDAQTIGDGWVDWQTARLTDLPRALTVRLLQKAWSKLRGEGDALSRRQIESIERVLRSRTGAVYLGDGYELAVEQGRTTMRRSVTPGSPEPVMLSIPGVARFGVWTVEASVAASLDPLAEGWTTVLDGDALGDQVLVRARGSGDRIRPMGMEEEVRLQDVLVNAKVPRSEREAWPLIVSSRGIAWVCGVRIAEWAKVSEQSTRFVRIDVKRD